MTKAEKTGWDAAWKAARQAARKWGGRDGFGRELADGVIKVLDAERRRHEKPKVPVRAKKPA